MEDDDYAFDPAHFLAFARSQGYYANASGVMEQDEAVYELGDTFMSSDKLDSLVPIIDASDHEGAVGAVIDILRDDCDAVPREEETMLTVDEEFELSDKVDDRFEEVESLIGNRDDFSVAGATGGGYLPVLAECVAHHLKYRGKREYNQPMPTATVCEVFPISSDLEQYVFKTVADGSVVTTRVLTGLGDHGALPTIAAIEAESFSDAVARTVVYGVFLAVAYGDAQWREVSRVELSSAESCRHGADAIWTVSERAVDGVQRDMVCGEKHLPLSQVRALHKDGKCVKQSVLVGYRSTPRYVEVPVCQSVFADMPVTRVSTTMMHPELNSEMLQYSASGVQVLGKGRLVGTVLNGVGEITLHVRSVWKATRVLQTLAQRLGRRCSVFKRAGCAVLTTGELTITMVPSSQAVSEGGYVLAPISKACEDERLWGMGPWKTLIEVSSMLCRNGRLYRKPRTRRIVRCGIAKDANSYELLVLHTDGGRAVKLRAPSLGCEDDWWRVALTTMTQRGYTVVWYGEIGRSDAARHGATLTHSYVGNSVSEMLTAIQASSRGFSLGISRRYKPTFAYIVLPPGTGKSHLIKSGLGAKEADDLHQPCDAERLKLLRRAARVSGNWALHNREWCLSMLGSVKDGDVVLVPDDDIGELMGGIRLGAYCVQRRVWVSNLKQRGEGAQPYQECYDRCAKIGNEYRDNTALGLAVRSDCEEWTRRYAASKRKRQVGGEASTQHFINADYRDYTAM